LIALLREELEETETTALRLAIDEIARAKQIVALEEISRLGAETPRADIKKRLADAAREWDMRYSLIVIDKCT
jgi:hypothetical protein